MACPKILLNNGVEMPQVGLGTWMASPEHTKEAIKHAVDAGYRHIDCAYVYQNEGPIGDAITELTEEGKVKREDLFIVSKLWCTFHSKDKVKAGLQDTLQALKTSYLDLYLLHAPYGFAEDTNDLFPCDENNVMRFTDVDFLETYHAMEKLVDEGLVRSLGISNFNAAQTQRLLDVCKIKPVTNQIECHPFLNNEKLRQFSAERGITLTAYAPLGSPAKPWACQVPSLLSDKSVVAIALKHGKTAAQILIRFALERGIIVIPKSTNPQRIRENFDVFDFALDETDLIKLMSLNIAEGGGRCFVFTNCKEHPHYPFHDEF